MAFAWKNSVNTAIGGVGMHFHLHALKSLNSIEKTQARIMCTTFNGNLCSTIISCYSPTHASDETDITSFYEGLSSKEILWKNQNGFWKMLHNLTDSDNPLINWRSITKESWCNTTHHRFFKDIWFHTQKKNGANTFCIWSSQRNCYC